MVGGPGVYAEIIITRAETLPSGFSVVVACRRSDSTSVVIENPGAFSFHARRCLPVVEAHVETSRHQAHYSSVNFHLRLHSNPGRITRRNASCA